MGVMLHPLGKMPRSGSFANIMICVFDYCLIYRLQPIHVNQYYWYSFISPRFLVVTMHNPTLVTVYTWEAQIVM